MKKRIRFFTVIIALSAMVISPFTRSIRAFEQSFAISGERATATDVVFSIPKGDDGIHYEGEGVEEAEVWGPASLRIAPDGTFLIVDTVTNKILRYTPDGVKIGVIEVSDAVSITDTVADGSNIFALDEAATDPAIHRFSVDGFLQERITLPQELPAQGLSGIAIDDFGKVIAEMQGGLATAHLDGQKISGKVIKGELYTAQAPDTSDKSADSSMGFIVRNGTRFQVKVDNIVGSLSVLSTGQEGDFYVLVEELADAHNIQVDQTLRRYSADGTLLGMARIPLAERYTYVKHGVAVAPDGNVYTLVTRPDRADVVRLQFEQHLEPTLPKTDNSANSEKDKALVDSASLSAAVAAACSRTRDQMINTAWSYVNNQTYLTTTNLNGTCSGRTKPRYLGSTAGNYNSVPYDWGGFDTVSGYNNYMSQGYKAGDIATSTIESCSRGVDCSGFLSRCWGTSRYTTATLPTISTEITMSQAQRGDIINKASDHVVMIESIVSNGVMTLESTMYNSYDRVVHIYNGWSRFGGYRFYRYNSVCETVAQARPVVSSSLTLSSGGPYSIGQTLYAYFTITNRGSQSITFSRLLVGGRLNGDQSCSGGCPDFTVTPNVTLAPGQSHSYSGSRYLDRAGAYSFFVAYLKTDGNWVTNVETENGARNSLSLTVQDSGPPSLNGHSPTYVYASGSDQTIYLNGARLANTSAVYVQFPNGSGAYIYPPGQVISRSYNQLGCKITFGNRGQYYLYAYTPEGGWSTAYGLWVY